VTSITVPVNRTALPFSKLALPAAAITRMTPSWSPIVRYSTS
jgi:hypothetical protein